MTITPELLQRVQQNRITIQDLARRRSKGEITQQEYLVLEKSLKTAQKTADTTKAATENTGNLSGAFKELYNDFQALTGGATQFESSLSQVSDLAISTFKNLAGSKSASGIVTTSFESIIRATSLLLKGFKDTIGKIEDTRIELEKSGVQGRKYILQLRRQQDALESYNITFKTLSDTVTTFREDLALVVSAGFPKQEEALRKVAAINDKFGVSVYESTRFINQLDTGLQMSSGQIDKFSRRLMKFAIDTGQPVKKVFNDFTASASEFFVELDPDKALKKFTVFQQIARRLGTEVSSLTRLTDNFESIETGMQFGGDLNMLLSNLGGSFDAVQATLMSQPERMEYIAKQVGQVGDRIRGMSDLGQRSILRALANTLNTDIRTVRALINREKGIEIQKFVAGTTDLQAISPEEQARRARELTKRDTRREIANDKLIGKLTLAAETMAQATTDLKLAASTTAQNKVINQLSKFTPQITSFAGGVKDMAEQIKRSNGNTEKLLELLRKTFNKSDSGGKNVIIAIDRKTQEQELRNALKESGVDLNNRAIALLTGGT